MDKTETAETAESAPPENKAQIKIVLHVEGGVVRGVYSNQKYANVEVLLIDCDNLDAEGISNDDQDKIIKHATESLMEHYCDEPSLESVRP